MKIFTVVLLTFMVITYNACSELVSSDLGSNDSASEALSRSTFANSLHPVLQENCAQCHGSTQSPLFAQTDSNSAFDIISEEGLVELTNPGSSYFLIKLAEGHNSFPIATINYIRDQIESWANALQRDRDPDTGGAAFELANSSSILFKIKNIVHGGALTNDEWLAHYRSITNKDQLKTQVDTWLNTSEGEKKLKFYLTTALNQDVSDARDFLGTSRLNGALRESFARTALDIINRDRPFTEIATTNRFAVNTRILAAYAYQDRRSNIRDMNLDRLLRNDSIDSDATDWRFVRFVQNDSEGPLYTNLANWRGIANEGTVNFGIPRVGFFSTLAFQSKYPSNNDNQFRVTINQSLIGGLSKTFSPSDPTVQPQLIHMDAEHAPANTQCFGCHRLMDPMRNIFRNKMNTAYRFSSEFSNEVSSFALNNYVNQLNDLGDLGDSIASHPDFHTSWTQKMCVALNTTKCLETDSEFIRVADAFKDSGFNFKVLYRELVTSPLVTGSERVDTNTINGFTVARTRRTHFCNNTAARIKQIQAAKGIAVDDENTNYCDRIGDQVGSLGDDFTIRGLTSIINSFPVDTFFRQGLEQSCFALSERIRRRGNAIFNTRENTAEESLDLITRYLMGIPESHPRYSQVRVAVGEVYEYSRNNQSMSFQDSIRQAVTFACVSPDFTGVGL